MYQSLLDSGGSIDDDACIIGHQLKDRNQASALLEMLDSGHMTLICMDSNVLDLGFQGIRTLGDRIISADLFNFLPKQVKPPGIPGVGWIDIDDSSADRKFPGALG